MLKDTVKLLESIRKAYKNPTKVDKKVFVNTLKSIFREIPNHKPVEYVSKKALKLAKQMNIDLSILNWKDQPKVDKGRMLFYYEHCNTVIGLVNRVLDTAEPIESIIKDNIICWITREENVMLDKNKYRSKRPGGWKRCYKECGIRVLRNK